MVLAAPAVLDEVALAVPVALAVLVGEAALAALVVLITEPANSGRVGWSHRE